MRTFIIAALAALVSTSALAEPGTKNFYDDRGNKIGSATTSGDTTVFYGKGGDRTGTATTTPSGTTNFYDKSGRHEGSATSPFGRAK